MVSLTPRQTAKLIRAVIGLSIVAVGIGIFAELVQHPELYPSRPRPLGASRPHWVFDLAFGTVLLGLIVLIPSRRKRGSDEP